MRFVAISICQKCTTNDDFFCRTLKKQPIFDQKSTFFRDLCPKFFVVRPKKASYLEKFVVHLAFFFKICRTQVSYKDDLSYNPQKSPSKISIFRSKISYFASFHHEFALKLVAHVRHLSYKNSKISNLSYIVFQNVQKYVVH